MGSCVSSLQQQNFGSSSKVDQMSSSSSPSIIEKKSSSSSFPQTPVKDIKDKPKPTNFVVETPVVVGVSFAYNKLPLSHFHNNSVSSNRNSISSNRSFGGSKDEAFYDTQAWLDSDCDGDFYSVNGDFTPSRSSTPAHPSTGTPRLNRVFSPQVNRAVFEGKPSRRSASNRSRGGTPLRGSFSSVQPIEPFPEDIDGPNPTTTTTKKSKKLLDLFKESMRERGNIGFTSPLPPKSAASRGPSGLRNSVSSIDFDNPAVVDDDVPVKEKPAKTGPRCFPRLARTRTFNGSKKSSDSPTSMGDLKA